MKIFVISDTHFNHENIIRYAGRPFKNIKEMNEMIIKKWNEKVGKEDLVIHLGDFALGDNSEITQIRNRLNGKIILIRGNHDHRAVRNAGFMLIKWTLEIDNWIFSHNPLDEGEIPRGFINVHGHIHEKKSLRGINVSVENINYDPIEIKDLTNLLSKIK